MFNPSGSVPSGLLSFGTASASSALSVASVSSSTTSSSLAPLLISQTQQLPTNGTTGFSHPVMSTIAGGASGFSGLSLPSAGVPTSPSIGNLTSVVSPANNMPTMNAQGMALQNSNRMLGFHMLPNNIQQRSPDGMFQASNSSVTSTFPGQQNSVTNNQQPQPQQMLVQGGGSNLPIPHMSSVQTSAIKHKNSNSREENSNTPPDVSQGDVSQDASINGNAQQNNIPPTSTSAALPVSMALAPGGGGNVVNIQQPGTYVMSQQQQQPQHQQFMQQQQQLQQHQQQHPQQQQQQQQPMIMMMQNGMQYMMPPGSMQMQNGMMMLPPGMMLAQQPMNGQQQQPMNGQQQQPMNGQQQQQQPMQVQQIQQPQQLQQQQTMNGQQQQPQQQMQQGQPMQQLQQQQHQHHQHAFQQFQQAPQMQQPQQQQQQQQQMMNQFQQAQLQQQQAMQQQLQQQHQQQQQLQQQSQQQQPQQQQQQPTANSPGSELQPQGQHQQTQQQQPSQQQQLIVQQQSQQPQQPPQQLPQQPPQAQPQQQPQQQLQQLQPQQQQQMMGQIMQQQPQQINGGQIQLQQPQDQQQQPPQILSMPMQQQQQPTMIGGAALTNGNGNVNGVPMFRYQMGMQQQQPPGMQQQMGLPHQTGSNIAGVSMGVQASSVLVQQTTTIAQHPVGIVTQANGGSQPNGTAATAAMSATAAAGPIKSEIPLSNHGSVDTSVTNASASAAASESATKAPHGKKRKTRDPKAPKPARYAWNFFFKNEYKRMRVKEKSECVDVQQAFTDLTEQVGRKWKSLPPKARAPYVALALEDKRRFERELAEYNGTSVVVKRLTRPGDFESFASSAAAFSKLSYGSGKDNSSEAGGSFGSIKSEHKTPGVVDGGIVDATTQYSWDAKCTADVLVCDDDMAFQLMLKRKLRKAYYKRGREPTIETAMDGGEMLDLILKAGRSYTMITLDSEMGLDKLNGIDTIKLLRKAKYDGLVVGITAFGEEEHYKAFMDGGVDAVLSKGSKDMFKTLSTLIGDDETNDSSSNSGGNRSSTALNVSTTGAASSATATASANLAPTTLVPTTEASTSVTTPTGGDGVGSGAEKVRNSTTVEQAAVAS